MTPERKRMLLWAATAGAVVVAGFAWTNFNEAARSGTAGKADTLHASYQKIYRPDKPAGLPVEAAQEELRSMAKLQSDELTAASVPLAPPIASAYQVTSLSEAAAQVNADYTALRQLAARTKILLPQSLPFEGGLNVDTQTRSRELASLALIRQGVQACVQAGMQRITAIAPSEAHASPEGDFATFACDLEMDGDWPAMARLLAALAQADGRGLGLRSVDISSGADRNLRTKLTMTLTTANRKEWGLVAMKPSPAANASQGPNQPAGGTGSRLRRTTGARP